MRGLTRRRSDLTWCSKVKTGRTALMDKTQLRDALKSIKNSLPKTATVIVRDEKDQDARTFTSSIKTITVGKGYGGTYLASFENGEVVSSRDSDRVISIEIDGTTYNKVAEKKVVVKQQVDEVHVKELFNSFSSFKMGDTVQIESTEEKFNNKFLITFSDTVHAPIKQQKIGISKLDNSGTAYLLSRRDSNIISSAKKISPDLKEGEEDVNEIVDEEAEVKID